MPVERTDESAPFTTTRAQAGRNTTTAEPLPSNTSPGCRAGVIRQDPLSQPWAVSLPFLLVSGWFWFGDLPSFQCSPVLTVSSRSPRGPGGRFLPGCPRQLLSVHRLWSRGIPLVPGRGLGGCSRRDTAMGTKQQRSLNHADPITKPQRQQETFLRFSPYVLVGRHLGAPSGVQLPSRLCAVCKCVLASMHTSRWLIHQVLATSCPSAAVLLRWLLCCMGETSLHCQEESEELSA